MKLHGDPVISDEEELLAFGLGKIVLNTRTFGAFPGSALPLIRGMNSGPRRGKVGWDIYSFISEKGWRLKVDIRWRNAPDKRKPLMLVLRNYDEDRWESESFVSGLEDEWNIAFLEVRGVGENGDAIPPDSGMYAVLRHYPADPLHPCSFMMYCDRLILPSWRD